MFKTASARSSQKASGAKLHTRGVVGAMREIVGSGIGEQEVWRRFIHHIRQRWEAPYAAIRLATGEGIFDEESVAEKSKPEIWRVLAATELTQAVSDEKVISREYHDDASGTRIAVHAVPVIDSMGRTYGAMAIITDPLTESSRRICLEQLVAYVDLIRDAYASTGDLEQNNKKPAETDLDPPAPGSDAITETLRASTFAAGFSTLDELAFKLTNSIKTRFTCVEVALGQVRHRRIHLLALSGTETVHRRTPGAEFLRSLMEECLDHGQMVYAQAEKLATETVTGIEMPLHKCWRDSTQSSNCVSVSLGSMHNPAAVLTLRRTAERPFTNKEMREILEQIAPVGEAIRILADSRRSVLQHLFDALRVFCKSFMAHSVRRRLLFAVMAFSIVWAMFVPWQHFLTVDAKINSSVGRIYAAPVEGRLAHVYVMPGQCVVKGDPLFEMDVRQQELNLAQIDSEFSLHRVRMVDALRAHNLTAASAEREIMAGLEAERSSLQQQIATKLVVAASEGIVKDDQGHLRTGERLPFGDPVITLATEVGSEVELLVEDHISAEFKPGLRGWFAAKGEPSKKRELELVRVEQLATVSEGKNMISVWARFDDATEALPFGAGGYAQIDVGKKPGWWILFHKPLRSLRWRFWPM